METQFFKADETELKFYNAGKGVAEDFELEKDEFFAGAYQCQVLGEILFDSGRSPLANAIPRDIFVTSFSVIYDSFLVSGSFESYLQTFRNIFGNDVDVTFTIPAAGKLQIDIEAQDIVLEEFFAKSIVNNAYAFDQIITKTGSEEIVFQSIKGFETEYELEQMLFEMVPAGIFTDINLTIGA